ncbi:ATP-dependent DNA helicase RecQ [Segetibacter sp.]|uniref:RecQ family ATP-dependent DNA helicase n=1 Tax=Segetibacter sp. TaxID=2231182 RepID=UPI002610F6EF|nr:ATP-dependent DNA helicase RecQ [Segetibacter sp.]MCW3079975.1 RecQ family ATP-dependent helicase [Segetibacter sp.]
MPLPQEILKQYWGHHFFRPLQEEIINAVMDGKDVLALLPTGGGKSICFQIPALAKEGLCLVISPLISLMKDQVENLKKRNIPALSIHSGMTYFEVKQTLQNAAFGPYKFLYVSPERLETNLFKEYLPAFNLNLIAIDEAHCISQWGYDFRPPYLRIAGVRKEFPTVPVLALTASATPIVQEDICDKLNFKKQHVFRQSFEKPNLSFSVFKAESKFNKLLEILQKVPGSAIVYCRNRKRTKEFANLLKLNNISAGYYHAGLLQDERNEKQEDWIENRTRVIVSTNAFGMGIDKPDVRVVVHIDIPDSLENYYQEAGRAGRDGKRAFAVLLCTQNEVEDLKKLPEQKYPSIIEIKKVYQALANHLQIPVGGGEGMYYDFNLNDFVLNFKLDIFLVINAIKALEQEGILSFNEQVFIPAKVGFTCTKENLLQFENSHPPLENLIKYLLRSYEGVFDNEVSINEKLISRLTKLPAQELSDQLKELQAFGVVNYKPQKETPQIFLLQNRAPAEHLTFHHEAYLKRKQQYQLRIDAMEKYVLLERDCRSQYIGRYFGDVDMKRCGSCDVCLQQKKLPLSIEEFGTISNKILAILENPTAIQQLLEKLNGFKKDKIWKVLDYLQQEGKVIVNEKGLVAPVLKKI